MEKILLVDGMNLLFQMFYGMPGRIYSSDGRPIWGTLGFVGALLKILRRVQPTHAAVLFDGECHNPRTDTDSDYKANRPDYSRMDPEETPFCQLPDVYAALDFLGIAHAETTRCEADDWLAGYARQYGGRAEVVIASFDSDLFQLISDRVTVLRYRGEQTVLCDRAWLKERLGIDPEQYADHKALVGDASDNIPGIRGIGPKTAAALLGQFGTLDALLAHTEQIVRPSVREAVQKGAERLRLNQQLICLSGREPLPITPEQMPYADKGLSTGQVLRAIGL